MSPIAHITKLIAVSQACRQGGSRSTCKQVMLARDITLTTPPDAARRGRSVAERYIPSPSESAAQKSTRHWPPVLPLWPPPPCEPPFEPLKALPIPSVSCWPEQSSWPQASQIPFHAPAQVHHGEDGAIISITSSKCPDSAHEVSGCQLQIAVSHQVATRQREPCWRLAYVPDSICNQRHSLPAQWHIKCASYPFAISSLINDSARAYHRLIGADAA